MRFRWALGCLVPILLAVGPSRAGRLDFFPVISLAAGYSNNLEFTDEEGTDDSSVQLGVQLPFTWSLPRGTLSFGGRATYVEQSQENSLSRLEYGGNLGYGIAVNSTTNLSVNLGYSRSQQQANPFIYSDNDAFLARRTESDAFTAGFNFRQELSPRWRWQANTNVSTRTNDTIEDFDQPVNEFNAVEDRDSFGFNGGVVRQLNQRSGLGVSAGYSRFDLDDSGVQRNVNLGVDYSHLVAEGASISLTVGAFRAEGEAADGTSTDNERIGPQGGISYNADAGRYRVAVSANVAPNVGDNLAGSALQTTGVFRIAPRQVRHWNWNAIVRYARRDPSEDLDPLRETYTVSVSAERKLLRQLGLAVSANYVNQQVDAEALGTIDSFNGRVGVNWRPRGFGN